MTGKRATRGGASGRRGAAIALFAVLLVGVGGSAQAQTAVMRERVYAKLSKAEAAAEAGDFEKAFAALDDVDRARDLTSYEKAQLYTAYGFAYYRKDELDASIRYYAKVLTQEELPPALRTGTLYTLAQLTFREGRHAECVDHLKSWLELTDSPGPDAYILLGQAHYQLQQYREAITAVRTAMDHAREKGRRVDENWYLLLRVLHYELDEWAEVRDILETLVVEYPKKEYWLQLAAAYGRTDAANRQLAAYEVAYQRGFLERGDDFVFYAQLLMQHDMPYQAGVVLERGISEGPVEGTVRNLRLLAQAWTLAREEKRAIDTLRQAAAMSTDGELDARLAQLLIVSGDWKGAVDAARIALEKGVEGDAAEVRLLLGMALFELGDLAEARTIFRGAQDSPEHRESALEWIRYIDSEEQRRAKLQTALR